MTSPPQIDPGLQTHYGNPVQPRYGGNEALFRGSQSQQMSDLSNPQQPYYLPGHTSQPSTGALDPALDAPAPLPEESAESEVSPEAGNVVASTGASNRASSEHAKRPRACDSCRGLKVKCDLDQGLPCKRCKKAGRLCVVTPPTRKRQKKADSRVAELERKIDALTASLHAQRDVAAEENGAYTQDNTRLAHLDPQNDTSQPRYQADQRLLGAGLNHTRPSQSSQSPEEMSSGSRLHKKRRLDEDNHKSMTIVGTMDDMRQDVARAMEGAVYAKFEILPQPETFYNERKPLVFDHSDIGPRIDAIIDHATQERIFNRYVNDLAPNFPAVPFPPGTSARIIRDSKPILYLAILSSTCYGAYVAAEAQDALGKELRAVFGDCMWAQGEKSLELVQALQVGTLWYRPPVNFEQHNFYQMVHLAAIIALDIGLGKRVSPTQRKWFGRDPPFKLQFIDSAEAKRAWLICYFLCVIITMVLRRPMLLHYNEYMRECIEYLETSPEALPSDKMLCQHARIAHICEEIAEQFLMDDPSANVEMSDAKVIYAMKHFERDLAEQIAKDMPDPSLKLSEHVTDLYIHEIALHYNHNVEEFKAPFSDEAFKPTINQAVLGPTHVDALMACQRAVKNIMDTFLDIDFEVLYVLPVVFSARVVYSTVVLIKLYIAAMSPGEMSTIIKKEDLHVESYLVALLQRFQAVVDRDAQSPHAKFLLVVQRLNERYLKLKRGDLEATRSSGVSGPTTRKASNDVSAPAQGLQLLSEVAMGGNPSNTNPNIGTQQPQNQPVSTAWYPPSIDISNLGADPLMQYGGFPGMDGFDLTLGGMGMEGEISGLFIGDGLWSFPEITSGGGMYQNWS